MLSPWIIGPRQLEFDDPPTAGERVYLGTSVDPTRDDGDVPWHRLDPDRPLVYCSLGTLARRFAPAALFLTAALDGFRAVPDWQLVVRANSPEIVEYARGIANVVAVEHVAQLATLERARVFVTHGGAGSIREAIYHGVPMVVCPCWLDQFGLSARIEFHRLGVRAGLLDLDGDDIRSLVEEVAGNAAINGTIRCLDRECRPQRELLDGLTFVERFL